MTTLKSYFSVAFVNPILSFEWSNELKMFHLNYIILNKKDKKKKNIQQQQSQEKREQHRIIIIERKNKLISELIL